ncbi:MAG: hypothetical protein Q8O52_05675 [Sulfuritalea sp.]|nr:hypothetical protein [Sulfuritalea sp.]
MRLPVFFAAPHRVMFLSGLRAAGLLPVFLTVAHRMLPFFTSSAVRGYVLHRPAWALRTLLGLSLAHGVLTFLEQPHWLWLVDLPAMNDGAFRSAGGG